MSHNIPATIASLMKKQKGLMEDIQLKDSVDTKALAPMDAKLFSEDLCSRKAELASLVGEIARLRATLRAAYSDKADHQVVDEKKVLTALYEQERKLRTDPHSREEWKLVAKAFVHKVSVTKLAEKDIALFRDTAFATQWRLDQCVAQSLAAQEVATAADEWAALTESQRMAIIMCESN